jgi:lysophospholipase L1-like esterase
MRDIFGKALLAILSCVIFLVVTEILLRLVTTGSIYIFEANPHFKDDKGWVRLKPNTRTWWYGCRYDINSSGFRMTHEIGAKRKVRILAIGDSITLGMGVRRTSDVWPNKLEYLINLKGSDSVEVINSGVQGWNLLNYNEKGDLISGEFREYLEQEGPKLRPDIIVYCICLNDVPSRIQYLFQKDNEQNKISFGFFPEEYREWLKRKALYRLLRDSYREYRFSRLDLTNIATPPLPNDLRSHVSLEIALLKKAAEKINASLYCIIVPYSYQLLTSNEHLVEPNKMWQECLKENQIPFIDMTLLMNEKTVLEYFALGDYIHLNSKGHELVAREVFKVLMPKLCSADINTARNFENNVSCGASIHNK